MIRSLTNPSHFGMPIESWRSSHLRTSLVAIRQSLTSSNPMRVKLTLANLLILQQSKTSYIPLLSSFIQAALHPAPNHSMHQMLAIRGIAVDFESLGDRLIRSNAIYFFAAASLMAQAPKITPARIPVEPKGYAWSAKIEFIPVHKAIRGIPISKIDPSWEFASELMKKGIPKEAFEEDQGDALGSSSSGFTKSGDFNKDGVADLALIGAFKRKTGEIGNFILILTKGRNGKWQKLFLDSWGDRAGFAVIDSEGPGLEIWFCMDCDHSRRLNWDASKKTFSWESVDEIE